MLWLIAMMASMSEVSLLLPQTWSMKDLSTLSTSTGSCAR